MDEEFWTRENAALLAFLLSDDDFDVEAVARGEAAGPTVKNFAKDSKENAIPTPNIIKPTEDDEEDEKVASAGEAAPVTNVFDHLGVVDEKEEEEAAPSANVIDPTEDDDEEEEEKKEQDDDDEEEDVEEKEEEDASAGNAIKTSGIVESAITKEPALRRSGRASVPPNRFAPNDIVQEKKKVTDNLITKRLGKDFTGSQGNFRGLLLYFGTVMQSVVGDDDKTEYVVEFSDGCRETLAEDEVRSLVQEYEEKGWEKFDKW